MIDTTLASAPPVDSPEANLAASEAALRRGDHRAGAQLAEQALAPPGLADTAQRALAWRLAALHRWRLGDAEAALRHATQATTAYAELGDSAGHTESLLTLCMAYRDIGRPREALDHAVQALASARRLGDRRLECWALNRVGGVYRVIDDTLVAADYTRQALTLARSLDGDDEALFASLNNLANDLVACAEYHTRDGHAEAALAALAEARQLSEEALTLARRSGNVHRMAVAMGNLAETLSQDDDTDAARDLIRRYQALAREHGFKNLITSGAYDIATVLQRQGRHALAVKHLLKLREQVLDDPANSEVLRNIERGLYESHKALKHHEQALACLEAHSRLERQWLIERADLQARVKLGQLDLQRTYDDLERLRAEAKTLARDARQDPLTGLANRRAADETLPLLLAQAEAARRPLALAMLDVDHFKQINDVHGHAVGDEVLSAMSLVLRARLRGSDLLARVGGEEFMLALPGTLAARAAETCERLRAAVAVHDWQAIAPGLAVTVSLGLVQWRPGETRTSLLERADAALYQAKRSGRDRVVQL